MPAISLYDVLGLIGVGCSVYAYIRVQKRRDYARLLRYSVLNLIASALILLSLVHNFNLSAFAINGIWGGVSVYGMVRCYKNAHRRKPKKH